MTSATTDRRLGLAGGTAYKTGATVLSTTNITQSGEQTIDTIAVKAVNAAGVPDRVLCVGMTDPTKNGLWDVQTGSWTRSIDANGNYDLAQGTQVIIKRGSAAFQIWVLTSADPITIGSTSLTWSQSLSAGSLAMILATLAASGGADLIGFLQSGSGAQVRTVQDRLRDSVDLFDFMSAAQIADYRAQTAALDHTAAFNAAAAEAEVSGGSCKLTLPAGILRLDSPITVTGPLWIEGAGHAGQATTGAGGVNNGTLIKFNHTGFGFTVSGSGFRVSNLGVYNPQTAPGGGWAPYASNYIFNLSATDTTIENVLFWGVNKGVIMNAGGRLTMDRCDGQFFNNGVTITVATDSVKITDTHMWPFWSQDSNVQSYMNAHLVAAEFRRCDGLRVKDFFSIWHSKCIRFAHDASGDTTNAQFSNIYSDAGGHGVLIEAGTNGVTAQFSNFVHQGTVGTSCGVQADGTNAILDLIGFNSTASMASSVRNDDGTGNRIRLVLPYFTQWNGSNTGFTGASCSGTGNELTIVGRAALGTAAAGATAAFGGSNPKSGVWHHGSYSGTTSGAGLISIPHGLGYIPGQVDIAITGAVTHSVHWISSDATNINCVVYTVAGATLNTTAVGLTFVAYY